MGINPRTILYIENNPDDLRLVRRLLEAGAYAVWEARDGLTGLDVAKRQPGPAMILVSMQAPGMNGYELASRFKALPALARVPVVAVLPEGSLPGDRERCLVAGCDACVSKPFDTTRFAAWIDACLGGKREFISADEEARYLRQHSAELATRLEEKIRALELAHRELSQQNEQVEQQVVERTQRLHQVEEQLVQSARLAAIGELVAGISHELANPLTSIRAFVQVLHRELGNDHVQLDKVKRAVTSLDQATAQLVAVVNRFLTFARKEDTHLYPLQLKDLIDESIGLAGHQAMKHNVKLINQVVAVHPPVQGIRPQLVQVFTNMIINAVYACEGRPNSQVVFVDRLVQNGRYIEIEIQDNGRGIDPENVAQIFKPFFTTRQQQGGTGLGLSVSKHIVEKHQGNIAVRSQAGVGTAFTVTLPIYTA